MKPSDVRGMLMGYLAARFEDRFLRDLGFSTFVGFSRHVAENLGVKENSVKNWRDEFDGLNPNPDRSFCTDALRMSSFVWLVSAMEVTPFSLKL